MFIWMDMLLIYISICAEFKVLANINITNEPNVKYIYSF